MTLMCVFFCWTIPGKRLRGPPPDPQKSKRRKIKRSFLRKAVKEQSPLELCMAKQRTERRGSHKQNQSVLGDPHYALIAKKPLNTQLSPRLEPQQTQLKSEVYIHLSQIHLNSVFHNSWHLNLSKNCLRSVRIATLFEECEMSEY